MPLDLNGPPDLEDGDIPPVFFADGATGAELGGEEGPVLGAATGAEQQEPPVFDLNLEPDLEQEDMTASGDEDIAQPPESGKNEFISNEQRHAVISALRVIASSNDGKLKNNSTRLVANTLGVPRRTVQRLWTDAKGQMAQGLPVDVSHKKSNCGRKKKDIDYSKIPTIALSERGTIRSLAAALNVSKSTLHRRFKMGFIRRHSSTLKPLLKDENKKARLRFCLSMLDESTVATDPKFKDMQNIVHIDEKWFNMTKKSRRYYLLPEEDDPHREVQNKNSIGKLMFLGVLAQPLYDDEGNEIFSGKIGIFPFVKEEPAARTSKNRAKGTMVTKSVIVTRSVMRDYLITKVLPAIKEKWPEQHTGKTIFIQQDNAKTHVSPTDPEFLAAVEETGLDIRLMQQPSNSPDMNILDLGFFSSIQSLTDKKTPRTLEDLIVDVMTEFNDYDVSKVKRVYLSLQACMIETMKCGGGNRYKEPHMNKDRLERLGLLPSRLSCDLSLVQAATALLSADTA